MFSESEDRFLSLATAAVGAEQQESETLYRTLITELESKFGKEGQKEIAAELQRLAKALEQAGKSAESFDFKQRTCAIMLQISMEDRMRARQSRGAAPQTSASPPAPRSFAPPATPGASAHAPTTVRPSTPVPKSPPPGLLKNPYTFHRLEFVILGVKDFETERQFYKSTLGAQETWCYQKNDTKMVAFRLAAGPLILLANNRKTGEAQFVFGVDSREETVSRLRKSGWTQQFASTPTPNGEACCFHDQSGNRYAFVQFEKQPAAESEFYIAPQEN